MLNEWLAVAPNLRVRCGHVGAIVSVSDFVGRPVSGMQDGEVFASGRYRFQWRATPHLPHGWDAGLLFEESGRILFCSDLFHQTGNPDALNGGDLVERTRVSLPAYRSSPFAHYIPSMSLTASLMAGLSALQPALLLPMHGAGYQGDGRAALRALDEVLHQVETQG